MLFVDVMVTSYFTPCLCSPASHPLQLNLEIIERTARLAAKCQIKDLYISVIFNFSGKESQMKRKCA